MNRGSPLSVDHHRGRLLHDLSFVHYTIFRAEHSLYRVLPLDSVRSLLETDGIKLEISCEEAPAVGSCGALKTCRPQVFPIDGANLLTSLAY